MVHEGLRRAGTAGSFPLHVQLLLRVRDHLDLVWLAAGTAGRQQVTTLVDDRVLLMLLLRRQAAFLLDADLLLHGLQHLLLGEMLLLLLNLTR